MEENKSNPSQEFTERAKLVELDRQLSQEKHQMRMEELTFIRETEYKKHEWELERGRIKSAEIRKSQERKKDMFGGRR